MSEQPPLIWQKRIKSIHFGDFIQAKSNLSVGVPYLKVQAKPGEVPYNKLVCKAWAWLGAELHVDEQKEIKEASNWSDGHDDADHLAESATRLSHISIG